MDFLLENLGKIGFEWKMALFNLVNFLLLFWILKRFFFKPIVNVINERQEKAHESVDNFQQAKTELQMANKKAQEVIDEGKVEANKIMENATNNAKQLSEDMKVKAREEIEVLVTQARKHISVEKEEMKEELRRELIDLVIITSQKVLGQKLDKKHDAKFIEEIVQDIERKSS